MSCRGNSAWKDKVILLATLILFGLIIAVYGEVAALLVAVGAAAVYMHVAHLKQTREVAIQHGRNQIRDLSLQLDIARKAFELAASGPDGLEVVQDLLEEYETANLADLRAADREDFLGELTSDEEDLKEQRRARLEEYLERFHRAKLLELQRAELAEARARLAWLLKERARLLGPVCKTSSAPRRWPLPPAGEHVPVESRDFWVKVVGMLQQNWALIEPTPDARVLVYFVDDRSRIFDQITFPSAADAALALRRNGFHRYSDDQATQRFLRLPTAPFQRSSHPNPIYSSGQFWNSQWKAGHPRHTC